MAVRIARIRTDLSFFDSELASAESEIFNLRKMVREYLELNNNRRNFVLTVLAAIFLPLSFSTSLLGMNMDATNLEGPTRFSNWTKSTLDGISPDLRNSPEALVSALGTTGTRLWTWKDFWIISGCLIVSLPLSLTLGAIFRLSVRYVTHYVAFWRALAVIPSAIFIVLSIFGNKGFWIYIVYDLNRRSISSRLISNLYNLGLASLAMNGLLILFEVAKVYLAWKNKRHRGFWSGILVLTVTCFTVDEIFSLGFWLGGIPGTATIQGTEFLVLMPWMVFPWLWFALRWSRAWTTRKRGGGRSGTTHQVPPS